MREVGVRELKEHASELLREVREKRESITITYRGKAVAQLVPVVERDAVWEESRRVLDEMEKLAQEIGRHLPPGTSAVDAVREQRREL